jgi:hypothetical protein
LMVAVSAPALAGGAESGRAVEPQSPSLEQFAKGTLWAVVHALRYWRVVVGAPEKQPLGPSPEFTHMPWLHTACAVFPVSNFEQSTSVVHCTMSRSTMTLQALTRGSTKAMGRLRARYVFAIASFAERFITLAMLVNRHAQRISLALGAEAGVKTTTARRARGVSTARTATLCLTAP